MLKACGVPSDPSGKVNIGKYVNVTNVTGNSWVFLNVSYPDAELGSIDENSAEVLFVASRLKPRWANLQVRPHIAVEPALKESNEMNALKAVLDCLMELTTEEER